MYRANNAVRTNPEIKKIRINFIVRLGICSFANYTSGHIKCTHQVHGIFSPKEMSRFEKTIRCLKPIIICTWCPRWQKMDKNRKCCIINEHHLIKSPKICCKSCRKMAIKSDPTVWGSRHLLIIMERVIAAQQSREKSWVVHFNFILKARRFFRYFCANRFFEQINNSPCLKWTG